MIDPHRAKTVRIDKTVRIEESNGSASNGKPQRALRVALYSHDAMGIGHVRRNLLIAQRLSQPDIHATSLLICGVHEATACTRGFGIDCLTLPSLEKHDNDDYRPRDLRMTRDEVSIIRSATLESALLAFKPHLLLVDKVPRGINWELDQVIPLVRAAGSRVVFGMREVLDDTAAVVEEWRQKDYQSFIRNNYDAVWVYGDPNVFDPIVEYGLAEIAPITKYTGYIDQCARLEFAAPLDASLVESLGDLKKSVLCMVGGGQDGVDLANAFAQAKFPTGLQGLLVTGPLMAATDRHRLADLAATREDLRVVTYVEEADLLMNDVPRVICMGGYNSVMSVVSFEKPALIVPRVSPRMEQMIRAQRFAELGFVDVLEPQLLNAAALEKWMADPVSRIPRRNEIDLAGLERVVELVKATVDRSKKAARCEVL